MMLRSSGVAACVSGDGDLGADDEAGLRIHARRRHAVAVVGGHEVHADGRVAMTPAPGPRLRCPLEREASLGRARPRPHRALDERLAVRRRIDGVDPHADRLALRPMARGRRGLRRNQSRDEHNRCLHPY